MVVVVVVFCGSCKNGSGVGMGGRGGGGEFLGVNLVMVFTVIFGGGVLVMVLMVVLMW